MYTPSSAEQAEKIRRGGPTKVVQKGGSTTSMAKKMFTKSLVRVAHQEQMQRQRWQGRGVQLYSDRPSNRWSCGLVFRFKGSVFPRALCVAIPAVAVVALLRLYIDSYDIKRPELGGNQIWTGYNSALAFLIIFRTQKAYSRWWEGGTLLQQVRGEWYNAVSSLVAFCTPEEDKHEEVRDFQHLLVRLMSLLYCSALQQVAMLEDDCFEILSTEGLDADSLSYLRDAENRCEVIISWIQKLVINNIRDDVIDVAPPIVSRVFQEISRGTVNLNNVKKIREFPFPFPYAQMITLMLMMHWVITPIASCLIVENVIWAGTLTFITIFAFWSFNYIAEEIEMPFGDDSNDLPIAEMQKGMNHSLFTLLQSGTQTPPIFTFRPSEDITVSLPGRVARPSAFESNSNYTDECGISSEKFAACTHSLDKSWPVVTIEHQNASFKQDDEPNRRVASKVSLTSQPLHGISEERSAGNSSSNRSGESRSVGFSRAVNSKSSKSVIPKSDGCSTPATSVNDNDSCRSRPRISPDTVSKSAVAAPANGAVMAATPYSSTLSPPPDIRAGALQDRNGDDGDGSSKGRSEITEI